MSATQRLDVVAEHTVILNDQTAAGLKKTNVILQHGGKQGLSHSSHALWIPLCLAVGRAGLGRDSMRSRPPMLKGEAFNPEVSQKQGYMHNHSKAVSRAGPGESGKKKQLTGDLIYPCKYARGGTLGREKSCSSPQNYYATEIFNIDRAGMNLG